MIVAIVSNWFLTLRLSLEQIKYEEKRVHDYSCFLTHVHGMTKERAHAKGIHQLSKQSILAQGCKIPVFDPGCSKT